MVSHWRWKIVLQTSRKFAQDSTKLSTKGWVNFLIFNNTVLYLNFIASIIIHHFTEGIVMFCFQFVYMEISWWVHVSSKELSIYSNNSTPKHNIGAKIQNCLLFYSQSCLFNLDETFCRNSQRRQKIQADPSFWTVLQVGKVFSYVLLMHFVRIVFTKVNKRS